jgi:hypothetical protein
MSDLHVEAMLASDTTPEADGDLLWKEAIFEGEFRHPQQRNRKFRVVGDGQSDADKGVIAISDLMASFENRAYDQVQVPLAEKPNADHADYARVNTGFVKKLRRRKREDGREALDVGILFTEPDVKGKVERGTVNNGSAGIWFNVDKDDGREFPCALRHYALTNTNWISGAEPFVKLSDDEEEDADHEIVSIDLSETVWSPKDSLDHLREMVVGALNKMTEAQNPLGLVGPDMKAFFLRDMSPSKALVEQVPEQKNWHRRTNGPRPSRNGSRPANPQSSRACEHSD